MEHRRGLLSEEEVPGAPWPGGCVREGGRLGELVFSGGGGGGCRFVLEVGSPTKKKGHQRRLSRLGAEQAATPTSCDKPAVSIVMFYLACIPGS